jgi:hypothetical protein
MKDLPEEDRLSPNYIMEFCRGEPIKDEKVLHKLANLEALQISISQLRAWWLLDKADEDERQLMFEELERHIKTRPIKEKA